MTRCVALSCVAVCASLSADSVCYAQEGVQRGPVRELDFRAEGRQFHQLFRRIGTRPGHYLIAERNGIRFQIPAIKEGVRVEYISSFTLTGNFTTQADFEILQLIKPDKGSGASFGISLDAQGTGKIALVQATDTTGGKSFHATRALSAEKLKVGVDYETRSAPTTSPRGRLAVRRENMDVVCLIAADVKAVPSELARWEFTDKPVHVTFCADTGGASSPLTVRLTNIRITADEVIGGLTQTELDDTTSFWWWWIPLAGASFATAWFIRVRRRRAEVALKH